MSIAGIASTLFSQLSNLHSSKPTAQSEFQQLAKDLQAGNLSGAQDDFAALQQNLSAKATTNPLSQAISTLGNDLKTGNLTSAQQDFANFRQELQQAVQQGGHHHHHHAPESQNSSSDTTQLNSIAQLFSTLGQDLQSGNLSSAQQAYASLQQDLQLFSTGASGTTVSAPVSVSA